MKKGFHVIKLNGRTLFLLSFFINQRAGPIIVKNQLIRGMVCAEIWGGEN